VTRRSRLDAELVRRGLARSREHASGLIAAGRVRVRAGVAGGGAGAAGRGTAGRGAVTAVKPATQVDSGTAISVAEPGDGGPEYASRGGHKLAGALAAFSGLTVRGRRCLDAGASTGGFTDALLRAGAAHVTAVDVGYGLLAWRLRTDPRVTVLERVNVRHLRPEQVQPAPDLVTADLSFISLTLVLPALDACASPDADFVLLVKPQFEAGKGRVGAGGVVRDPAVHAAAVTKVACCGWELGIGTAGVSASPLPGPAGNVEYFLWLRRGAPPPDPGAVDRAIAKGPR
jgi:23S rRNA (cytidine1920-2'-O)/16S rRNA (cytidine1409-2'-O)-methyltransferase